MKSLKFDHELAKLIKIGSKTETWRVYDDKDLNVNDLFHVIDKVNPKDHSTWAVIGTARVTRIIEKYLGDIDYKNTGGHEPFASKKAMLDEYKGYYGDQITLKTLVKQISFTFIPLNEQESLRAYSSNPLEVKLYSDGGSRGNPGPSASGYVLLDATGKIIKKGGEYLGITTSNQAEYQALKLGLEEALSLGHNTVSVYLDSLLVVNQMKGVFKVKNRDLWPIHQSIKEITKKFKDVTFKHVPRELNKMADKEVNEILDATTN